MALMPLPVLLAVHIGDGQLTFTWLLGGFVVAGLLVLIASLRMRDDDVPRVAVLTAAFFVASLIHVRLGPTPVHLVLNGLLGVVLGWRAPLAVFVGLGLQAVLMPGHGGFTTLGVNTCVMAIPALLASVLFQLLHRKSWLQQRWFRGSLIWISTVFWLVCTIFAIALVCTNPIQRVFQFTVATGTRPAQLALPILEPALALILHPLVIAAVVLIAMLITWWESRQTNTPEFALGLFLGILAVLLTLVLNAVIMIGGGIDNWADWVEVIFVAHLPLAILEGIILGFTVGFLAKVKPELLDGYHPEPMALQIPTSLPSPAAASSVQLFIFATITTMTIASPAHAHRLVAEFSLLPEKRIQIESWFETGDSPRKATVQVFHGDGKLLNEGPLDEKSGKYVFPYLEAETLKVIVSAPGGHRAEVLIPQSALTGPRKAESASKNGDGDATAVPPNENNATTVKDVMLGIAFLLALAAFVMSLRNAQKLRSLESFSRDAKRSAVR